MAIGLGRPLLVSGEPGCGKTELGYAIARRMGIPRVHFFSTKSNSEARDLFYTYDAVGRFREAQAAAHGPRRRQGADRRRGRPTSSSRRSARRSWTLTRRSRSSICSTRAAPTSIRASPAVRWSSSTRSTRRRASFPNDLLREIEDLAFRVPELSRRGSATPTRRRRAALPADRRPIVVVTSNEERQLPDAFLRRCVFHEIAFPDDATMMQIVASGLRKRLPSKNQDDPNDPSGYDLPGTDGEVLLGLLAEFRDMRLDKRPGISETIDAATLLAYPRSLPKPSLAERPAAGGAGAGQAAQRPQFARRADRQRSQPSGGDRLSR